MASSTRTETFYSIFNCWRRPLRRGLRPYTAAVLIGQNFRHRIFKMWNCEVRAVIYTIYLLFKYQVRTIASVRGSRYVHRLDGTLSIGTRKNRHNPQHVWWTNLTGVHSKQDKIIWLVNNGKYISFVDTVGTWSYLLCPPGITSSRLKKCVPSTRRFTFWNVPHFGENSEEHPCTNPCLVYGCSRGRDSPIRRWNSTRRA